MRFFVLVFFIGISSNVFGAGVSDVERGKIIDQAFVSAAGQDRGWVEANADRPYIQSWPLEFG